jgi:DNA gyrase subunit A
MVADDETELVAVIVSEKGWAKQVAMREFPTQGRGGQGVQTLKITAVTGKVAAATLNQKTGNINVISGQGRRYHLSVADFPSANRVNRGDQMIDFGPDDTIQQLTPL